jgi:hypothetical protein
MKATKFQPDSSSFGYPCIAGSVERGNGESMYVWALFMRKDVPENLIAAHMEGVSENTDDFDLAYELTGWVEYHYGVGRAFGPQPSCKVGRNHILVSQLRALDI